MMDSPALTFALAVAAGMLAQVLAGHLRSPGRCLLLAAGVLLGPDGAGLIQPDSLGAGLPILVGFAVAAVLTQPPGEYLAMNGNLFDPEQTRKNVELDRLEAETEP